VLDEAADMEPVGMRAAVHELMDCSRNPWKAKTTSTVSVNSSANIVSLMLCGWSRLRISAIRSTTFTTRTRSCGNCCVGVERRRPSLGDH
jgi:hypothetical protein